MRLLNVETLQLEVFDGGPRVTFAILSHTWGEEEITFQDMMSFSYPSSSSSSSSSSPTQQLHNNNHNGSQPKAVEQKKGFSKILNCCAKARREGYKYVWIDTCCIDKSSSAELSEAINSMFKWYHEAEVCYAFLSDVTLANTLDQPSREAASGTKMSEFDIAEYGDGPEGRLNKALHKSRWFTRGWTLQELLAPLEVVFVDSVWCELGTRETLAPFISEITGIDSAVLRMERSLNEFSIAQRMSWASNRNTTRIEDEAYCLMGLFDVSMPLLYGEGRKAFKRLQLEIMRQSTDRSILAWASPDSQGLIEGVLASSPAMFEDCGGIHWNPPSSSLADRQQDRGYESNNLNHNACHDIIGFSLKMEAGVLEPPHTASLVFREYWDFADEDGNMLSEQPPPNTDGTLSIRDTHPLAELVHYPRDIGELYTHAKEFREFDYGFLRHKKRTVVLVMLDGCTKGGGGSQQTENTTNTTGSRAEYTVGITLCSDTDGLMKRVHFPSRFLIPSHLKTWLFTDKFKTLHAALTGSEVLQQPMLPNFAKCMVRVPNMSELPYYMAYTIPSIADSSTGVWYLERWGTIPDLASLELQPCFSLHRTGTGRAMVFHHREDPNLSFVIIFTLVKEGRTPTAGRGLIRSPTTSTSTLSPSLSRQSTSSANSLTSSITSLTSTFSRTFTSSSTSTSTSIPSPSSPSIPNNKPPVVNPNTPTSTKTSASTPSITTETAGVPAATRGTAQAQAQNQNQKQYFTVTFISGPEALNLGFESDLAPFLPPLNSRTAAAAAATTTTTQPVYSYTFDLPDPNFSLSIKIRKAPKVSNAGGKNYNALLGFEYKSKNTNTAMKVLSGTLP